MFWPLLNINNVRLYLILSFLGITFHDASSQDSTVCDVSYLGSRGKGVIRSPNFPFNYYNNRKCEYIISFRSVPFARQICFNFRRFRLENDFNNCADSLKFPGNNFYCEKGEHYDGMLGNHSNVFNDKFCWDVTERDFVIEFYTNSERNSTGFYAEFDVVKRPLGEDSASNALPLSVEEEEEEEEKEQDNGNDDDEDGTKLVEGGGSQSSIAHYKYDHFRNFDSKTNISKTLITRACPWGPCVRKRPSNPRSHKLSHYRKTNHRIGKHRIGNYRELNSRERQRGMRGPHRRTGRHQQRRQPRSIANICAPDQERCWNGNCISGALVCNGQDDCGDNSDETYEHSRCQNGKDIHGCDFEGDSGLCGFLRENWHRNNYSPGGPRYDHTYGSIKGFGLFMYTNYIFDRDVLLTYPHSLGDAEYERCLSFWYHMSGQTGTLTVQFELNDEIIKAWHRKGDQGAEWNQGQISIPTRHQAIYQVHFRSTGAGIFGQIGLDDIALLDVPCYSADVSCTFELDTCNWANDGLSPLDWVRWMGDTIVPGTGPKTDGDGNVKGYYIYLDSLYTPEYGRLVSAVAYTELYSPKICITLQYHMHGSDIGTLRVKIRNYEGIEETQWERSGSQADQWYSINIQAYVAGAFQVVLEATSQGLRSHIAIDNIQIHSGRCDIEVTTTTTISTPRPTCNPSEFQCREGSCIPLEFVCDGHIDCPDMSDEEDCSTNANMGLIIGVTSAAMIVVLLLAVLMVVFFKKRLDMNPTPGRPRRRFFSARRDAQNPDDWEYDENISGVTPMDVGDPPPLYEQVWEDGGHSSSSMISVDGPVPRITISLSWEPPPAYDFALNDSSIRPSGDMPVSPPIYTISDSFDEPPPQYQPPPEDAGVLRRIRSNITGAPRQRSPRRESNTIHDPNAIQVHTNSTPGNERGNERRRSRRHLNRHASNEQNNESSNKKQPKNKQIEEDDVRINPQVPRSSQVFQSQRPNVGAESARRMQDDNLSLYGDLEPDEIAGVRSIRRSRGDEPNLLTDDNLSLTGDIRASGRETVV